MPPRKACDVCFKRKIQCSIPSAGAPCNWCSNQKIACTFDRKPQKKKPNLPAPEAVYALSRRVLELEAALARRYAGDQVVAKQPDTPLSQGKESPFIKESSTLSPSASLHESSTSAKASDVPRLSYVQLGRNWYFRGMQILSAKGQEWIESKSGQESPLRDYVTFDVRTNQCFWTAPQATNNPRSESLPNKYITHALLDEFFRSNISFFFPVFDRTLINATVEAAYRSTDAASAKACVWALHAWSRHLQRSADPSATADSDICSAQCQLILEQVNWASSLEALQAILLLLYKDFHLNWNKPKALHAIACQMAWDAVAHADRPEDGPDGLLTDRERRHGQALFGLCYVLDKDIALRSGNRPLLTEDYCDISFLQTGTPGASGDYSGDLGLSLIKERTCRLLYSPKATNLSDGDILQHIRQLDDELEQWRLSIPQLLRPRLSIPADFCSPTTDKTIIQNMQLIRLQLEYHYTLMAIHTMVRKCGANKGHLPEDLHAVVHSSVDLSLEAGRSTFTFFKFALQLLGGDTLYYIQQYAPVAAMALFVDILVHPLGKSAQPDLEVLMQAVGLFQTIPIDVLSMAETKQIQALGDFIMELARLASGAIWKTKTSGTASKNEGQLDPT